MHLVTGSYFKLQSHNEDCGHAMQSAIGENPMLHEQFTALCVTDAELLAKEFSHHRDPDLCWHAGFRCESTGWLSTFSAPVTLTLTQ